MLDPLLVDKGLLFRDGDGSYRIGLILETERVGTSARFLVRQAVPAHLRKNGGKGKVVGAWHFLSRKWDPRDARREEGKK